MNRPSCALSGLLRPPSNHRAIQSLDATSGGAKTSLASQSLLNASVHCQMPTPSHRARPLSDSSLIRQAPSCSNKEQTLAPRARPCCWPPTPQGIDPASQDQNPLVHPTRQTTEIVYVQLYITGVQPAANRSPCTPRLSLRLVDSCRSGGSLC